jgi:hypothetical protein
MTIRFIPLTKEETLKDYPRYFREDVRCFLILKDETPVGLYGLIDRGVDEVNIHQGEGFLTIFPAFRFRVMSRDFLQGLFDHAFTSGFQKVYTWTRLKSWATVLHRFTALGITCLQTPPPWDSDPSKIWFVKENRKES